MVVTAKDKEASSRLCRKKEEEHFLLEEEKKKSSGGCRYSRVRPDLEVFSSVLRPYSRSKKHPKSQKT